MMARLCHDETHLVFTLPSGESPQFFTQEVCRSIHGPIVATAITDEQTGFAYARQSSHRMQDLRSAEFWLSQAKVDGLAAFDENLEEFAFTFNFFFADASNIAYRHVGFQPVRVLDYDHRLPRPGDSAHDWSDILHGSELPRMTNPSQGWLANWNNLPARGWSGGDDRNLWGQGHRVELLQELIPDALDAAGGKLSLENLEAIQEKSATRDPFARHLVPVLLDALVGAGGARGIARDLLQAWADADYCWCDEDADGTYDHDGHAIWDQWRARLQEVAFRDELGDLFLPMDYVTEDDGLGGDPHGADHAQHRHKDPPLINAIEGISSRAWLDDVTTAEVETPTQVMLSVLDEIVGDGGHVHVPTQAVHQNAYTSLTAFEAPRHNLINRGTYVQLVDLGTGEAENVLGPGTWGLVDPLAAALGLGSPENLATYNPHFLDQFDLYRTFEYRPFWLAEADVRAHLDGTITLGGARDETTLLVPVLG
jgi:penicillin amidase